MFKDCVLIKFVMFEMMGVCCCWEEFGVVYFLCSFDLYYEMVVMWDFVLSCILEYMCGKIVLKNVCS